MEWIEEFLSNPEHTAALGYGAVLTAVSAYGAYRNDFGAADETDVELEDYLDKVDPGITSPLKLWKQHEYRKEQNEREDLADGTYDYSPEDTGHEGEAKVYADD